MTRFAAFLVVLSLLCTSNAWAQKKQREPAKKTWSAKKKPAKKARPTPKAKAPPASAPAPSAEDEEPAKWMDPAPASASQGKPATDAPKAQAESETPAKPPSVGDSESMDFDLLEPVETAQAAQVDPELEKRISRRRTMLKLHQGLGFALVGGLAATTVVGQLQFNDSFRGGGDDRNLLGLHRGLAIGTSAIFATVGMLGLLAPEPFEKEFQWDTVTVHKILMSVATVAMVAQVILGIMSTNRYGRLSERDYATAHQVVGFTTMGAVTAGVLTLFF
ncbi:hypothetical protein [Pyxidicoccus xibeiensis]|uniref:hypothetical protein n=1 Tax=Pyxidicoccus xibeiensis TaxID=2906759 RepID=UPI0020A83061|nr:hypothetical protein [Pyxidicoccus xibeiensis]MCP3137260.1 hypothetical protein [Pyxidicoccus xibeiensis]